MEPCGTPVCISWGIDILPSTEILNCLCERNKLVSLFMLVQILLDNLYKNPECLVV